MAKLDKKNQLVRLLKRLGNTDYSESDVLDEIIQELERVKKTIPAPLNLTPYLSDVKNLGDKLQTVSTTIATLTTAIEFLKKEQKKFARTDTLDATVSTLSETFDTIEPQMNELKDELEKLQKEMTFVRERSLQQHGGGSMPRQLAVSNTVIATRYADLNFIGSGVTITTANNDVTKKTDITLTASGASIPPGVSFDWSGSIASVPTGYLFENGASLLRAGTFAPLFAAIGTIWGSVDGTHFNLPDSRNRVAMGACIDTAGVPGSNVEGGSSVQCGGSSCHTHTIPMMTTNGHQHSATLNVSGSTDQGFASIQLNCTSVDNNGLGSTTTAITSVSDAGHTHTLGSSTASGLTDIATDTTPPNTSGTSVGVPRFYAKPKIIKI